MPNTLEARVAGALTNIRNPRVDNDLISAGMIQDLNVGDDGVVNFTFLLGRDDPATLVREARQAVKALDGVTTVKVKVKEPNAAPHPPQGSVPNRGPAGARQAPAPGSAPEPMEMPELGHVIAISSGKGGVGKSTVSANLAVQLAKVGKKVGLMDADIYGPNIPRMFGVDDKPPIVGGKIMPLESHGVKLMSLGFMIEREQPAIWRGPIIMKIINQFLRDVNWGGLDYLLIDLPPGTGDAQLSLVQAVQVTGAIIVTTPQEVAIGDALRGAKMFEKVNVPVLGVVENMSFFECPSCGEQTKIFLSGGGAALADEVSTPLMAQIPLQAQVADDADNGMPVVVSQPDSPAARAFDLIATKLGERVGGKRMKLPIVTG